MMPSKSDFGFHKEPFKLKSHFLKEFVKEPIKVFKEPYSGSTNNLYN